MGLNNNITIFTIVPVTRKGETNTTDRKIAVVWNNFGGIDSLKDNWKWGNEFLYGVIKLSPLMKLK